MSQAGQPTHLPREGAELEPIAYHLSVQFHPPIKLTRQRGLEFAAKLAGSVDASGVELAEQHWTFSEPLGAEAGSVLRIIVAPSELVLQAEFPTHALEFIEKRYGLIFKEFQKSFRPELMLRSSALIRATLQIDGDARTFLANHVTKFDMERLKKLGRPVHLFGIRLFMPPYQKAAPVPKGKKPPKRRKILDTVDWMIDIKAESLIDNTSKLFLEAQAEWQVPRKWDDAQVSRAVEGLSEVSNYLRKNWIPFLHGPKQGNSQ